MRRRHAPRPMLLGPTLRSTLTMARTWCIQSSRSTARRLPGWRCTSTRQCIRRPAGTRSIRPPRRARSSGWVGQRRDRWRTTTRLKVERQVVFRLVVPAEPHATRPTATTAQVPYLLDDDDGNNNRSPISVLCTHSAQVCGTLLEVAVRACLGGDFRDGVTRGAFRVSPDGARR